MAYYITSYNSIDLNATCGVVTPGVGGPHDLPDRELSILKLPGSDTPHVTVIRRQTRSLQFRAVAVGTSHSDLVTKLGTLKGYLMPDDDFHALIVADRSSQRIMALCEGFPINISSMPDDYLAIEFGLNFLAYPYWEDASAQSTHITSSPTTVANGGQMVCYPTYTCEINATMATGLWFQVGSNRFTYTGALASSDSLVVESDQQLPDVKLNGTRAWAGVAAASVFPSLAVGNNTVTLSDAAKFHLTVAYRRRYW